MWQIGTVPDHGSMLQRQKTAKGNFQGTQTNLMLQKIPVFRWRLSNQSMKPGPARAWWVEAAIRSCQGIQIGYEMGEPVGANWIC